MRQRSGHVGRFEVVDKLLGAQPGDAGAEPLDEQEQETLIREFETLSSQEHRQWKLVFGGGTLAGGLFLLYAAWRQHVEPFGARYTGELRSVTSAGAVIAVLLVQAASMLVSAGGLLSSALPPPGHREVGCLPFAVRQRIALWSGAMGATGGAAYWAAALVRLVQVHGRQYGTRWELTWLPIGPLAACLLCCYVASVLTDTEREVQRLRSYRYRYKKL